jgi:hypothetical protein
MQLILVAALALDKTPVLFPSQLTWEVNTFDSVVLRGSADSAVMNQLQMRSNAFIHEWVTMQEDRKRQSHPVKASTWRNW